MPLLEETGYVPTEKYAHQPELLEHAERIATHYGLHEKALFQTEILSIHWEEYKGVWRIITNHNDTIYARFVVLNSGPLHRPKLPGTPGIEKFKGHAFHSSRFDYEYCGKDLSKLQDKKVAIIGTGECASFFVLSLSLSLSLWGVLAIMFLTVFGGTKQAPQQFKSSHTWRRMPKSSS